MSLFLSDIWENSVPLTRHRDTMLKTILKK